MRKALLILAACLTLATVLPASVEAQRHRPARRGVVVFVGGYFYDPFFGPYPWWPRHGWPYPYYPVFDDRAIVRLRVEPKQAAVYVDGYYAGLVDDFDGVFQQLPVPPGPHEITFYLVGYRTYAQRLYLPSNSEFTVRHIMQRLEPGEISEPPFVAPPVPPPPPGTATSPRIPNREPVPPPTTAVPATLLGTLAIQVQPPDAEVVIDGARWATSDPEGRLNLQVAEGTHHITIRKPGYRAFSTDVQVRCGDTTPLNVTLYIDMLE